MKKYQIIYADPPWEYDFPATRVSRGGAKPDYSTMDKEELCNLPIRDIAADDSMLLMWVIFPHLDWAFAVMNAWGFKYVTNAFTWIKQNKSREGFFWGMGQYTRSNAEICLLGKRGNGVSAINHSVHSVVVEPISKHSRKPPIVRQCIAELFGDLPRIELFARKESLLFDADGFDGWDVWGNEVQSDVELEVKC